MDDESLLRYSRHILLDAVGVEGQERINQSRVLVVGAGGLGSAALPYLASAGVGHLTIVDGDTVDLTNLQRQIIHRESRIGSNKALSAVQSLKELNSTVSVEPVTQRADAALLDELVSQADVVLDCTDNFSTRHAINRAVVKYRRVLVSGAAIRMDGQVAVFDMRTAGTPCYACLFPDYATQDAMPSDEDRCGVMGVFAPLVGMIGAMQVAEALRVLVGIPPATSGRLQLFSATTMQWREVRFRHDPQCPVCRGAEVTNGSQENRKGEIVHA